MLPWNLYTVFYCHWMWLTLRLIYHISKIIKLFYLRLYLYYSLSFVTISLCGNLIIVSITSMTLKCIDWREFRIIIPLLLFILFHILTVHSWYYIKLIFTFSIYLLIYFIMLLMFIYCFYLLFNNIFFIPCFKLSIFQLFIQLLNILNKWKILNSQIQYLIFQISYFTLINCVYLLYYAKYLWF